jgi:hypothetical protein
VDTINGAMASAIVKNYHDNETVHDYLKYLDRLKTKTRTN